MNGDKVLINEEEVQYDGGLLEELKEVENIDFIYNFIYDIKCRFLSLEIINN